ncbi:hypothetical protein KCU65_g186, partial [Aureobasidium melanogenum]
MHEWLDVDDTDLVIDFLVFRLHAVLCCLVELWFQVVKPGSAQGHWVVEVIAERQLVGKEVTNSDVIQHSTPQDKQAQMSLVGDGRDTGRLHSAWCPGLGPPLSRKPCLRSRAWLRAWKQSRKYKGCLDVHVACNARWGHNISPRFMLFGLSGWFLLFIRKISCADTDRYIH